MTPWTLLTFVAFAAACTFAAIAWRQHREARRRSDARVAALSAAIDGPFEVDWPLKVDGPLEAFTAEAGLNRLRQGYGESRRSAAVSDGAEAETASHVQAMPARRAWMIAAGGVPLMLVVAALLITRGPRPAPVPAVSRQPDALELLDMHHDRSGDVLTVTGTVRVRGRDTAPVTAVVTGRDGDGHIVASAHAPLDDSALDLGGESSFQVSVPGHDVRRYQVRFETPLGPLTHVDRRAERTAAPATP